MQKGNARSLAKENGATTPKWANNASFSQNSWEIGALTLDIGIMVPLKIYRLTLTLKGHNFLILTSTFMIQISLENSLSLLSYGIIL